MLGVRPWTFLLPASGQYTAGEFVPAGDPEEVVIDAAVQPISGRTRESLPSGDREAATMVAYIPRSGAGGTVPSVHPIDRLAQSRGAQMRYLGDVTLDVLSVEDWTHGISHRRVILGLRQHEGT